MPKEAKMVLVVDDEPVLASLIERDVIRLGYRTMTAQSVSKALDIIRNNAPDIILTDNRMPKESGFDLAKWLHSQPQLKIKLIMMSGDISDADRNALAEYGVDGFLEKP